MLDVTKRRLRGMVTAGAVFGLAASLGACAGQQSEPASPSYQKIGTAEESLEERVDRLERDLAELRIDYSMVRPAMERLVLAEDSLDDRVARIEDAFGPATASLGQSGKLPARSAEMNPVSEPADPAPKQAAAPKTGIAYGIHLASYRDEKNARAGWEEIKTAHARELSGLEPYIRLFDAGKDGTYRRLLAGPVSSRADADALCQELKQTGLWCQTLALDPVSN